MGQLNFGGAGPYNATGPGGIAQSRDNIYQAWDVFAWQRGRHSIKFGGEFDAFQYVRFEYADPLGSLTFTSGYTNATAAAPKAGDTAATPWLPRCWDCRSTAVRTLGPNRIDGRQKNYAAFVQDDIRITPTLTLNRACATKFRRRSDDIRHQMSSIDFSTAPSPVAIFAAGQQGIYSPTLFVCGKDGYPDGLRLYQMAEFQPARWGWRGRVNAKTVIRAGGGNLLRHAGRQHPAEDGADLAHHLRPDADDQRLRAVRIPVSMCSLRPWSGSAAIQAAAIDPAPGHALFAAVEFQHAAVARRPTRWSRSATWERRACTWSRTSR